MKKKEMPFFVFKPQNSCERDTNIKQFQTQKIYMQKKVENNISKKACKKIIYK